MKKVLKKLIMDKNKMSVVIDLNWKKLWSLRMNNPEKDVESLKLNSKGLLQKLEKKLNL